MTNVEFSLNICKELMAQGVQDFVFCAGSRNAPIVQSLNCIENIKTYSFFEERSAAFFALGKIKAHGRPVAVVTTSGTAVAELLPACIEAHYSNSPLVLVTADRPQSYRGSGAPQSIEQVGLFSHYVEKTYDFSAKADSVELTKFNSPIHINICFDEPLVDDELQPVSFPVGTLSAAGDGVSLGSLEFENPLLLLTGLDSKISERVYEKIKNWNIPVYVEAPSQLRSDQLFKTQLIKSGDKFPQSLARDERIDSVIRIGDVPTLRFWRDLEESSLPVTVISKTSFAGLAREAKHISMDDFMASPSWELSHSEFDSIMEEDQQRHKKLMDVIQEYPKSEASLFHKLSNVIGKDQVFMGNSLPIRQWDLAANLTQQPQRYYANRGANGIDGLLSTFLGTGAKWAVVGDLSALYDLSSLWAKDFSDNHKWKIVVVNNQGGKIFSRIYKEKFFQNNHQMNFSHWAKLFGLEYAQGVDGLETAATSDKNTIIEINPDNQQSELFWKAYEKI